jgi:hypothetical protein
MFAFILEQILQFWPPYREGHHEDVEQQDRLSAASEQTAQNIPMSSASQTDEGRQRLAR